MPELTGGMEPGMESGQESRELLAELYDWALDACHQGAGAPMTEPAWHGFTSTWEDADDLLPRVAAALGRPDPRA